KRPIANDFNIFVRLRAMGDRPSYGDGIAGIDVFIYRDNQLANAIAIIKNALHGVPGFLVIALFQTDDDVRPEIDQWLHKMDLAHGIQSPVDEKAFDQGGHAHRFDFGAFAGRHLADDGNPDGILSVGDAL